MSKSTTNKTAKKKRKPVSICDIHINMSFNNIIVTIVDISGNVLSWSSGGKMGFKGTKKSTPYAAKMVVEDAMKKAFELCSIKTARAVIVKGICSARESAIRAAINLLGYLNMPPIEYVEEATPVPHNGCKMPKRRRV